MRGGRGKGSERRGKRSEMGRREEERRGEKGKRKREREGQSGGPNKVTTSHIRVQRDVCNGQQILWQLWYANTLQLGGIKFNWVEFPKLVVGDELRSSRGPEYPVHKAGGILSYL